HSPGGAAPAMLGHERALTIVASVDGALHLGRDRRSAADWANSGRARPLGHGVLALLQRANQEVQRASQDFRHVAGRDLVREQILGLAEVLVGFSRESHLQREALRCEWNWRLLPLNAPQGALA